MADVERGWLSVSQAAKYAGLNPEVLRRAILTGALEAHEKPTTYPARRVADETRRKRHWITKREFIDAWLRAQPTPEEVM